MWPTERDESRLTFLREAVQQGLTLNEIGQVMGVTRERARQILVREGLNTARKGIRSATLEQTRRERADMALRRWRPYVEQAIAVMQAAGLPVTVEHVFVKGHSKRYRVVAMLGGKPVVFRHDRVPMQTVPNGPSYWSSGEIREPDRPHVLVTPTHLYGFSPPILRYAIYVRAEPMRREPAPLGIRPDFILPMPE